MCGPKTPKIRVFLTELTVFLGKEGGGGEGGTTYMYLSEPPLLSYLLSPQSFKKIKQFTFGEIRGYPELRRTPSRLPQRPYIQRGAPGQHALCHTTGKGFVKEKKGLYHDALKNQRATVIVAITESFGGICPELYSFYHKRGKKVRSKALADRTVYSRHRLAPKTFKRHHLLHLSVEVQRADANHINEQVLLARYCAVRKDKMDGGVGRSDSSDSHSSGSDSPDEGGDDDDGDDSRDALQDQCGAGPGDDTSEGAAA